MSTILLLQRFVSWLGTLSPAVWAAFISLVGVLLALRHQRIMKTLELKHDSRERDRERQMSWRRDVFLDAAESVVRLSSALAALGNLEMSDRELTQTLGDHTARLNRVQVVGTVQTTTAVNKFLAEMSVQIARLSFERGALVARRNQIESLSKQLSDLYDSKRKDEALISEPNLLEPLRAEIGLRLEVQRKQIEWCSSEKAQLWNDLPARQMALTRASMEAAHGLGPLLLPALASVRQELGLEPFDYEQFDRLYGESAERIRSAVQDSILTPLDQMVAGEQNEASRGTSAS